MVRQYLKSSNMIGGSSPSFVGINQSHQTCNSPYSAGMYFAQVQQHHDSYHPSNLCNRYRRQLSSCCRASAPMRFFFYSVDCSMVAMLERSVCGAGSRNMSFVFYFLICGFECILKTTLRAQLYFILAFSLNQFRAFLRHFDFDKIILLLCLLLFIIY